MNTYTPKNTIKLSIEIDVKDLTEMMVFLESKEYSVTLEGQFNCSKKIPEKDPKSVVKGARYSAPRTHNFVTPEAVKLARTLAAQKPKLRYKAIVARIKAQTGVKYGESTISEMVKGTKYNKVLTGTSKRKPVTVRAGHGVQ